MNNILPLIFKTLTFTGAMTLMVQPVNAQKIMVQVENIQTEKPGNILVMLFGREGFPKDHAKALTIQVLPATVDQMKIEFSAVPAEFAIKVLHDEDETGKVTKNWTRIIPAEGLGFSRGAKLRFKPPSFANAKVKLADTINPITIKMIYP